MSTYVAVFALLLGYVALLAAYVALRTLAKLRRATALLARGSEGRDAHASLLELTHRQAEQTALLAEHVAVLQSQLTAVQKSSAGTHTAATAAVGALRNVALVRYDAFTELSGRMSFSLALLDENGDGVTISAVASSTDTRVYAKGVADGKGEHDLSPEEAQAVAAALDKRRGLLARKAG